MTITEHKTRAVFGRYDTVSPAALREAARKLGELGSATLLATKGQVTAGSALARPLGEVMTEPLGQLARTHGWSIGEIVSEAAWPAPSSSSGSCRAQTSSISSSVPPPPWRCWRLANSAHETELHGYRYP
jgi:hypothetical protein